MAKNSNEITLLNGTDLRSWNGIRLLIFYASLFYILDTWQIRVGLTVVFIGLYLLSKATEVIYFRDRKAILKKHLFKNDEITPLSNIIKVIYYEIWLSKYSKSHVRLITKDGMIPLTETSRKEVVLILNDLYDATEKQGIKWNEDIEKYPPFLESNFKRYLNEK